MRRRAFLVLGIGCFCLGTGVAFANVLQAQSADTISGRVVAAEGPVTGAVVRVRATELSTVTDGEGHFQLTGLVPGIPVYLTAWAPGYYITGGEAYLPGVDNALLTLVAHTNTDNSAYKWLSAFASVGEDGNCENCHATSDTPTADLLPFDEWILDAHALSAANSRFQMMYLGNDANGRQSPLTRYGHSRDYGTFPLAPDPSQPYYGPGYKLDFPVTSGNCATCHTPAAALSAPYGIDPTQVVGADAEGITCDFCHKVWEVRLNPATGLPYPNMPGVLSFIFRRPPDGHQFFAGPYDDVGFEGSEDTYSPLQLESAFCAPCHFGMFWDTPIYNSFGEWLDSPYSDPDSGQTCQDCHMPSRGATRVADHEQAVDRDPATIFSHRMPGAADEAFLQHTAELTVTAKKLGEQVRATVEVTNSHAGHHIPTDSPLRQIFVVVSATDSQGAPLPLQEGPVLPGWAGDLAGQPGVYFAKLLQELWTETMPSGAYWNPTRIVEDTRLPALATSTSAYVFSGAAGGPVTVEARLVFRRAFYELMQQKGWDVPDIVMEHEQIAVNDIQR